MVLDPLIAVSLAGNIVQFIDFTTKLVSKGHKIYKTTDGILIENAELEAITRKIIALNNRIVESFQENTNTAKPTATERDI